MNNNFKIVCLKQNIKTIFLNNHLLNNKVQIDLIKKNSNLFKIIISKIVCFKSTTNQMNN